MSGWQISEPAVDAVVDAVEEHRDEIARALRPRRFDDLADDLALGGVVGQEVHAAVDRMLAGQAARLSEIGDRLNAGIDGVRGAVGAYAAGQEQMALTFQNQMLRTALAGDSSGWPGVPDGAQ